MPGKVGASSALDDVFEEDDLTDRGGPEDLNADTEKGDRGNDLKAEEGKAEEGKTEEGKAEEGKTEEGKTEEGKTEEGKAEEGKAEEGKAEEGKAEEGKAEEGKADDEEAGRTKPIMIPKARYDSLRARFDTMMEQIEKGKARAEPLPEEEKRGKENPITKIDARLDAIEDEIDKAVLDSDHNKAKQLRREQRQLNNQRTEILVQGVSVETSSRAIEKIRYDQTVAAVEKEFPWINPDSDQYDEERALDVNEMVEAFEAKGYRPAQAVMRAMKYFATPVEDRSDDGKLAGGKKKTDVKKNIDAATRTPANMRAAGADNGKAGAGKGGPIDPAKLSDEDFDALPESTKSRLRGDEA